MALLLVVTGQWCAQTAPFRENGKWGLRNNQQTVVPAIYDTLVANDSTGGSCLACYQVMSQSANKFIRVLAKNFHCNYLDPSGRPLSIKTLGGDTCSVFSLGKLTVRQFTENARAFVVGAKNKKYLVGRNFRQLTFGSYSELAFCNEPSFLIVRNSEGPITYTGLINLSEAVVVPCRYADVRVNPHDSLVVACSGALRASAEDDVYLYNGTRTASYRRHVQLATRRFIVHKLYEPKELYIVYNLQTKEERQWRADEVLLETADELRVRVRDDWYFYNMPTGEKRPIK